MIHTITGHYLSFKVRLLSDVWFCLTRSYAPSCAGTDDSGDSSGSHRLSDRHLCPQVSEDGEHGGQRQGYHDVDLWGHVSARRWGDVVVMFLWCFGIDVHNWQAKSFSFNLGLKPKRHISVIWKWHNVISILLGVCGIAGVSVFANLIVSSFRFTTYADGGYGGGGVLGGGLGGMGGSLTPRYIKALIQSFIHFFNRHCNLINQCVCLILLK